jgi:hypothetical protein
MDSKNETAGARSTLRRIVLSVIVVAVVCYLTAVIVFS